jgi:hypothetical protein
MRKQDQFEVARGELVEALRVEIEQAAVMAAPLRAIERIRTALARRITILHAHDPPRRKQPHPRSRVAIARGGATIALDEGQLLKVQRASDFLADKVRCGEPIYGVTTGFGSNADKLLGAHRARDELPGGNPETPDGTLLEELQHNLVITHAVCVGKPFAPEVVRAMLAIRINTLMRGHSGIRVSTLAALDRAFEPRRDPGDSGERLGRPQAAIWRRCRIWPSCCSAVAKRFIAANACRVRRRCNAPV